MKRKYFYVILISSFLYVSCFFHSNKTEEGKGHGTFVFNIEKAQKYPDETFVYSSLYKRVSVLLLETKEDCLIGRISKIQVFDSYIIVLDSRSAKGLFVFDKEGFFIRKIGNTGSGPGEYLIPKDFTIDKENKIIYVLDNYSQRINKYEFTSGNYIHSINLEKEVRSYNIEFNAGKLYADAFFQNHTDDNYLLRIIDESSGKDEGHHLNVTEYNQGISNVSIELQRKFFYTRENGNTVFVQTFMNQIIEINRDSILSLVELNGRDFLLTSDETKKIKETNGNLYSLEVSQLNKYHSIHSFVEKGDSIFVDIKKDRFLYKFLMNKKTNEVYVLEKIWDDMLYSVKDFGPVPTFGCYDAGGVYYYADDSHLTSRYQALANAGSLSPDIGRLDDLKNLEEDANPILFYYEFED